MNLLLKPMNLLLNILWIILGGWLVCLEYLVSSLVLMITIIGIPFGVQTIKLAMLGLCPFGCTVETTPSTGGCLNILMNLIWILCGALTHVGLGVLLCITIIGIPFGRQHFKLAALALTPFGKRIVNS